MADTDESGDRVYFWMAEVMAMHSDITNETGSMATETGRLLYCMRDDIIGARREKPKVDETVGSIGAIGGCASRFMLCLPG